MTGQGRKHGGTCARPTPRVQHTQHSLGEPHLRLPWGLLPRGPLGRARGWERAAWGPRPSQRRPRTRQPTAGSAGQQQGETRKTRAAPRPTPSTQSASACSGACDMEGGGRRPRAGKKVDTKGVREGEQATVASGLRKSRNTPGSPSPCPSSSPAGGTAHPGSPPGQCGSPCGERKRSRGPLHGSAPRRPRCAPRAPESGARWAPEPRRTGTGQGRRRRSAGPTPRTPLRTSQ